MWPMPLPDPIVIVATPAANAAGTAGAPGAGGAGGVHAFTLNIPAGTWPAAALPVPFVLALPRSRDVGAEAAAELQVALRAWPRVSCTAWRTRYDGERTAVAADDGVNVVLFHDDAWPAELSPGAIAQTVIHTDAGGQYRDADIHINGADFHFSLDGRDGTQDLLSILTHELGHALGLGHSADPRATMFATGSGLRWRSLEADDAAGVCSLYPGTGTAGCEALPCPAPFLCVASTCQRPGDQRDVCSPCLRVDGACEAAGDDARCIDIGVGATAGRVCGRSCAADAECGAGFHCLATTAAGDLQCVSDVGCRNGASPCTMDAQCTNSTCRAGACLGPADPADAGADGGDGGSESADAGQDGGTAIEPGGGGCSCRAGAREPTTTTRPLMIVLAALLALLFARFCASRRRRSARG
jgi:hypothetical protein